jgi:hypothetical protein
MIWGVGPLESKSAWGNSLGAEKFICSNTLGGKDSCAISIGLRTAEPGSGRIQE